MGAKNQQTMGFVNFAVLKTEFLTFYKVKRTNVEDPGKINGDRSARSPKPISLHTYLIDAGGIKIGRTHRQN